MAHQHLAFTVAWRHGRRICGCHTVTRLSTTKTTTTTTTVNPKTMVQEMRQRVEKYSGDPAIAWDSLWKDGITPWDLGGPTKALISEIDNRSFHPAMTLIPGCGSGYDVRSLGRYLDRQRQESKQSFTIVGLELSKTSLQKAQSVLEESLENHGPLKQTEIVLYEGDFFTDPSCWKPFFATGTGNSSDPSPLPSLLSNQRFDFIFDYTFFCAIPPDQRRDWGRQMARLLAPKGKLLTLMFPYHSSTRKSTMAEVRGPPYLVTLETYKEVLGEHRLELDTPLPYASFLTARQRRGQEVVGWWHVAKL